MDELRKVCMENDRCTRMNCKDYATMLCDVDEQKNLTDDDLIKLALFIYSHSDNDDVKDHISYNLRVRFIVTVLNEECMCWLDEEE